MPQPLPTFAAGACMALLAVAGCSKFQDDRGIGDAPADQQPDRPVKVWAGPDQFMNVGAYCIGVDGIYIHTRQAAPVVVPSDPNCAEGGILTRK